MKSVIFAGAFVLLMLAGTFVLLADDSSADIKTDTLGITTITGDTVLTEDLIFKDNSVIIVEGIATIDVSTYTLDFGKKSLITILGSLTLSCQNGKIIVGEGTSIKMIGLDVPAATTDICYTYDGDLMFDKHIVSSGEAGIKFVPRGEDKAVHASWDNCWISVADPNVGTGIVKEGIELRIRFSVLDYHKDYIDDEGVLTSTKDLHIEADKDKSALGLLITLQGTKLQSVDVKNITSTVVHIETNVTDVTTINNIGPTTISMESDDLQHLTSKAESIVSERYNGDLLEESDTFNTLNLSVIADPSVLLSLIIPIGEEKGLSDILRYVELTAETADLIDYTKMEEKLLKDLSLTVNGDKTDDSYLIVKLTDVTESTNYTITATKLDFITFNLSRDLVMDVDVTIGTINVDKDSETEPSLTTIYDSVLKASNLNIKELYRIYSRTGTIEIQQLLDYSDRLEVGFGSLLYDKGKDDIIDLTIYDGKGLLCVDARDQNTASVGFSYLETEFLIDNELIKVKLNETRVYLESDGSLTECINAFTSGIDFTSDAHSEVQVLNDGMDLAFIDGEKTLELRSTKVSKSSTSLSVLISIDHSMYQGRTGGCGKMASW